MLVSNWRCSAITKTSEVEGSGYHHRLIMIRTNGFWNGWLLCFMMIVDAVRVGLFGGASFSFIDETKVWTEANNRDIETFIKKVISEQEDE